MLTVYYLGEQCQAEFPDDPKYFKLTRRYLPELEVEITTSVGKKLVMIKELKVWTETRSGKFNKHHLTPKQRGGQRIESNLLRMDISRHNAWHLLFSNLTLLEIIDLLKRLYEIKERQRFRKMLG
jgi:hypothetical protein